MARIHTIGLDIGKEVFQVHGIDAAGKVLVRKQLLRAEVLDYFKSLSPCLVGIEVIAWHHHQFFGLQSAETRRSPCLMARNAPPKPTPWFSVRTSALR